MLVIEIVCNNIFDVSMQAPVLACLHAVEAFQKSGQQLPVNLKVSLALFYRVQQKK